MFFNARCEVLTVVLTICLLGYDTMVTSKWFPIGLVGKYLPIRMMSYCRRFETSSLFKVI